MLVIETSATGISDTCVVQDVRFHSLWAALDSPADEKEMMGQLEEHKVLTPGFSRLSHLRLLQANPGRHEFWDCSPTSSTLTACPSHSMSQSL